MVRRLLLATISGADDIDVVVVCSAGEEALSTDIAVDVWLMDQRMSGITGSEVCRILTSRSPAPQVLLLTAFPTESVSTAYRAGACGYLFKDEPPSHLLAAIRAAAVGFTVNSKEAMAELLNAGPLPLNPAYHEWGFDDLDTNIARCLLSGMSYIEIAGRVHLSESGVKKRIAALMKRFGVRSRPQLMSRLHELMDAPTAPGSDR